MCKNNILAFLAEEDASLDELASYFKASKEEIKKVLDQLVFEGQVYVSKEGLYVSCGDKVILCTVKSRYRDYAYVTPLKKDMHDIRLVGEDADSLLEGDYAFVLIDESYVNNGEGTLIKVIKPINFIEGKLFKDQDGNLVVEDYRHIKSEIVFKVIENSIAEAVDGAIVRCEIIKRGFYQVDVKVVSLISLPGSRDYELVTGILEKGGVIGYPKEVEEEAEDFSRDISFGDRPDRKDLREEIMMTIDGETTKDFDDGLSVKRTAHGYDVGVHIADVASYVKEGSALDYEARLRETSLYFPETEIPMLPKRLSEEICSLNPHQDKLTITCLLHLSFEGILEGSEVFLSKTKSCARLTYDQVDDFLKGNEDAIKDSAAKDSLSLMIEASRKIEKIKKDKGHLVFGRNYPEFTLDAKGFPDKVRLRKESEAENLVENFMVLANNEVGRLLLEKAVPTLFRVEDGPDKADLFLIRDFLERFGIDPSLFPVNPNGSNLAKYFDTLPEWASKIGKLCMLKMMNPVVYSRIPGLHFGLDCTHYVYFTSPIRRYPDLLTHRLLHEFVFSNHDDDKIVVGDYLDSLPDLFATEEKKAKTIMNNAHDMECERYMSIRMNQIMVGEVRNFIGSGIKVQLSNGITGLLPYDKIGDDSYRSPKFAFSIFGNRSGKEIVLGDELNVAVIDIIKETHTLILGTEEYIKSKGNDGNTKLIDELKKKGIFVS